MKINIALLEDEIEEQKRALELFSLFSKENNFDFNIDVFTSSEEIKNADLNKYQLIMLDIILTNENVTGIDVAKYIRKYNQKVGIVFVTKTVLYAVQGYEVQALDYVVKPLVYEDLSLKLKQYLKNISNDFDKSITLKCTDRIIHINESKIYYFEIFSHYVDVHTDQDVYKARSRISDIEKLVSSSFARISRYCIVNLQYIDMIKKNNVFVKGQMLKITDNFKKSFMSSFNLYLMQHGK